MCVASCHLPGQVSAFHGLIVKGERRSIFLLLIIYLGFISLGLPDGALGVAWPAIYPELKLPLGLAGRAFLLCQRR